jgi:hypothetical protein
VSFTNNGKTLDNGTYALNSQGYVEDQTPTSEFTNLGSYALQAQYSGDNSFNASTNTLNATVTQGPTSTSLYDSLGGGNPTVYSGQSFQVGATAYTQSVLAAPAGTVTLLQNGAVPSGPFQSKSRNGSFSGNYSSGSFYVAYLSGSVTTAINSPGTYTFTGSYAGDVNYTGSQGAYSVNVTVLDTTFNISSPIPNVTIAAPGQSGTATLTLVQTDNFLGTVNISCALPAAMTEATCPSVTTTILGSNVTAPLITTTAPHQITASSRRVGMGLHSFGVLAGVFLFTIPFTNSGIRRRRLPLALLLLGFVALIASCGSGSSTKPPPQIDPGTPAGTYTVNVTATSSGITRTASFNVAVQ